MFSQVARNAGRQIQRRSMSLFENKNMINDTRSKFYSNPAVGAGNSFLYYLHFIFKTSLLVCTSSTC